MLSPNDSGGAPLKNSTIVLGLVGILLALAGLLGTLSSGEAGGMVVVLIGAAFIGWAYLVQIRPTGAQAILPLEETEDITAPPRRGLPQIPQFLRDRTLPIIGAFILAILLGFLDSQAAGIGVIVLALAVLYLSASRRSEIERIVVGATVAHNAVHPSQGEVQRLHAYVAALRELLAQHNIELPPLDEEEESDIPPFLRRASD